MFKKTSDLAAIVISPCCEYSYILRLLTNFLLVTWLKLNRVMAYSGYERSYRYRKAWVQLPCRVIPTVSQRLHISVGSSSATITSHTKRNENW